MASDQQKSFGLSMHGQAKYSANSKNLEYVNPKASKGGNIKMSAIGTFDTLNPFSLKGKAPTNMNLVYDRLMRRVWDEPFTMYPLIAKAYSIAPDRSWIRFWVDERAKFHDGSPITVDDIDFSFKILRDYGRPNMRRIYKLVKKIQINKEQQSITFKFGKGYDRETALILAMMPILSKSWWEDKNFNSTITQIPLLNGPYRIKSFEIGRNITYERVKDYWAKDLFVNKGQYNFNTITYDYFKDDTIALEAFKKGDFDIRREWDISKWQSAYHDINKNIIKTQFPHKRPERASGFFFNTRKAPFDDINIRKAISLAFDNKWILKNLYHNKFKHINSFFPNSVLSAPKEITDEEKRLLLPWKDKLQPDIFNDLVILKLTMRQKLKKASDLLDKSGWIIENGKRINKKTKQELRFEILLTTPQDEKIAITFQRALERLGVQMDIRMADSATFQKRKQSYDYDMLAFYVQFTLSPGTEQTLYWTCKSANEIARFNYSGICNPALDHFAMKIGNARNYDNLILYANIIDRIALSEHIFVPFFYKNVDYIAYNKNILHPKNTPVYGAILESWWHAYK